MGRGIAPPCPYLPPGGRCPSAHTGADEERRYVGFVCISNRGNEMEQNKRLTPISQKLRKNATKEENLLWYKFLRHYKPQFRRQYVIGNYIVDFYCHKARLVVELDGSQHCEERMLDYDRERTAYLQSQDLCVFRISNLDVMRHFENVCAEIDRIVKNRSSVA